MNTTKQNKTALRYHVFRPLERFAIKRLTIPTLNPRENRRIWRTVEESYLRCCGWRCIWPWSYVSLSGARLSLMGLPLWSVVRGLRSDGGGVDSVS